MLVHWTVAAAAASLCPEPLVQLWPPADGSMAPDDWILTNDGHARLVAATALLVPRPETDPGSLRSAIERWIELHPFVGAAAPEVAVEGGSLVVRGGLDLSRETVV